MTRKSFILPALIAFTFLTPATTRAEEQAPAATTGQPAKVDLRKSEDGPPPGPMKDWVDAENALIDPLSDKDLERFYLLRTKYSYISGIRVAERDVGNAVKSCGEKNPGLKEKMESRFKQWQNAVDPILVTADESLEREIKNLKYVDPAKVKNVFKLQKAAAEHTDKQTTKTVITTEEACNDLLDSMDDTEDSMISLLQEALLPESVLIKRADEADKMEKAQAAKMPAPGSQSTPKDFGKKTP